MTAQHGTAARPDGRREDRATWNVQFNGEMSLRRAGHADMHVTALRNVSAGGSSVLVPEALLPGSQVLIVLGGDGVRLEFVASVAWCRLADKEDLPVTDTSGATSHAAGLQLRGPGSFAAMLSAHAFARG
jgi:hypothetical protein